MTISVENGFFQPTRREFVAAAGVAAAGLAGLAPADALLARSQPAVDHGAMPLIHPGQAILFQGDSITDAGRNRGRTEANDQAALGNGYAWFAALQLLVDHPDAGLRIFNRGISGNKVFELAGRWQQDCLDLKPDVLSILIGVNDYWHMAKHGYTGTLETYETDYRNLVARTKDALPNVRLVICEPFVLRTGEVDDAWIEAFAGHRAAARRVADEAGTTFVPFQTMFDKALALAPPQHWAGDGVHPSPAGAFLMAHTWLNAVGVADAAAGEATNQALPAIASVAASTSTACCRPRRLRRRRCR